MNDYVDKVNGWIATQVSYNKILTDTLKKTSKWIDELRLIKFIVAEHNWISY